MRFGVIISLVVVGGLVVVAPVVAEYRLKAEHQAAVARLLERGATSVTVLEEQMSPPWSSAAGSRGRRWRSRGSS